MRQVIRIAAGEHERFAAGAFDSQVGKSVPFKLGETQVADATVVAAEVAEDGTEAVLTVDIPDAGILQDEIARQSAGLFSFAVPDPKFRPKW